LIIAKIDKVLLGKQILLIFTKKYFYAFTVFIFSLMLPDFLVSSKIFCTAMDVSSILATKKSGIELL
jgi:hypothetical protein